MFLKGLHRRYGGALISAMIAVAIVSIVTVVLSKVTLNSHQSLSIERSRNQWDISGSSMSRTFYDEVSCLGAFRQGDGLTPTSFITGATIDSVAASPMAIYFGEQKIVKVGENLASGSVVSISEMNIYVRSSAVSLAPASDRYLWQADLVVKSSLSDVAKTYSLQILTSIPATLGGPADILSCSYITLSPQQICSSVKGGVYSVGTKICRVGAEARTSDPGSPVNGQFWLRVDL